MPVPRADSDRVGVALAWGVVFSLVFHVILFSPQLAALLDPEQRNEALADAHRKAREQAAPPKPDGRKDPREQSPDRPKDRPEEARPPEPQPEGAQQPPPPPADPAAMAAVRPIETPEPSPAYPDVEDVAIGQDDGDAMSVVIIGRDDFEEHMAQQSVVSQAGFRMSDAGGDGQRNYGRGTDGNGGGGGGGAPNASATTVTATAPGTPSEEEAMRTANAAPVEKPDGPAIADAPAKPAEQVPVTLARAEPKEQPAASGAPANEPQPVPPTPPAPTVPTEPNPAAEPTTPPVDAPRDPKAPPPEQPKPAAATPPPPPKVPDPAGQPMVPTAPATPTEARPTLPPAENQPPKAQPGGGIASTEKPASSATDVAPGEAGKAGGSGPSPVPGTGGKGELSDLESPATSVTQVDPKLWRNGRLVAAQGIQLKPRQPQFTSLQMVSMLPGCRPPVVSLTFDRTGKCLEVFFNRSSGDSEIDGVIRNSLFFWRAAGKKIDQLQEGEKVRVTLQLIL